MELATCHPSGTWVFEIGPRIFGKCADLSHCTNIYMPFLGVSEEWFRSHLTNRRQKVAVNSPNSTQNFFCVCDSLKFPKDQFWGLYCS
jgi:hypothetical protein